jgi:hypothetical protein
MNKHLTKKTRKVHFTGRSKLQFEAVVKKALPVSSFAVTGCNSKESRSWTTSIIYNLSYIFKSPNNSKERLAMGLITLSMLWHGPQHTPRHDLT